MFLYSILRWGNEKSEDGPDGYDTEFLVRALDIESAARLVDKTIKEKNLIGNRVQDYCHSIVEIGISHSSEKEPKLLYGPIVSELSRFSDNGISNDKKWVRDSIEEGWISFIDYYED